MNGTTTTTFASQMPNIFRPTYENTSAFMADFKRLTPEDKAWFHDRLNKEGYPCLPPGEMVKPQ